MSEIDFSGRGSRTLLDLHPWECRAHMLRTVRWKYILHERFRPQLFDLDSDPGEFVDLGDDPGYEECPKGVPRPVVHLVPPPPQPHRDAGGISVRNGTGAERAARDHDRALVNVCRLLRTG